ncbi:hypothetical protein I7I53_08384 [Histoplasma capsulatum var. duboisii H88]|uniref:Uncharacterized protein n=1 Tax=Ajellomyces capsulatus (strain H88) TaxID=544711 RepID=A0A8A1LGN2_AJEC8|nr:hypothetical protein I7I53_08384 [Histoplasma capsulatum var. duboisii H88]
MYWATYILPLCTQLRDIEKKYGFESLTNHIITWGNMYVSKYIILMSFRGLQCLVMSNLNHSKYLLGTHSHWKLKI